MENVKSLNFKNDSLQNLNLTLNIDLLCLYWKNI